MGISNLLQGLKYCTHPSNIRDFAGQAVAVDASSWLHKSVYSIADHYVEMMTQQQGGTADARSVAVSTKYIIGRCQELLTYAKVAKVYLVIDGKRCPLKAVTNQDREAKRQENLKLARHYQTLGQRDKMYDKYKMCIQVKDSLTQQVMKNVQKHFRGQNIEIVYSPYEADAQLAKLCKDGTAQAVITEDSDVLVYSASCRVSFPVIFKLDRDSGSCQVVELKNILPNNPQKSETKTGLEPVLLSLALREDRAPGKGTRAFVQACVLAGCDYASNDLKNVGLVNAFKQVQNSLHKKHADRFQHILRTLPKKARGDVDIDEYETILSKSEAVFYYHPVRQLDGRIVYLNEVEQNESPRLDRFDDHQFLGSLSDDCGLQPSQRIAPNSIRKLFKNVQNQVAIVKEKIVSAVKVKRLPQVAKRGPMENPYQKDAKKQRIEESQKENPFARFSASKAQSKENRVDDAADFRFVKPKKLADIPEYQSENVVGTLFGQQADAFDYSEQSSSKENVAPSEDSVVVSQEPLSKVQESTSRFFVRSNVSKSSETVHDDRLDEFADTPFKQQFGSRMTVRPKKSLGPAKVMRNRYKSSSTNTKKKGNILQAFQLQRELAGEIEAVPDHLLPESNSNYSLLFRKA